MLAYRTRDELLRLYKIKRCDMTEHDWMRDIAKRSEPVFGLRFEPRDGNSQRGEIESIDVVFNDRTLVPEGMAEQSVNGDRKLVLMRDVKINEALTQEMQQKLLEGVPDPLPEGWTIHVEPLAQVGSEE